MAISIWFEKPIGTRHPYLMFEPGESIRVTGDVGGTSIIILPGTPIHLTLYDGFAPMQWSSQSYFFGHFWFDITLPNVVTLATVRISVETIPAESKEVQIGIGIIPQTPEPPGNWWDKYVPYVLVAGGTLLLLYSWPVIGPGVKRGVRSLREGR